MKETAKEYVSIFVTKDTRQRIKVKASQEGKSMMQLLEEFSKR